MSISKRRETSAAEIERTRETESLAAEAGWTGLSSVWAVKGPWWRACCHSVGRDAHMENLSQSHNLHNLQLNVLIRH